MESKTTSIQEATISKAIRMLHSAKARYAVIVDGVPVGNLPIKPISDRAPRRDFEGKYKYCSIVDNIAPGGDFEITAFEDDDVAGLRSSISSRLTARFGAGSYMSNRDGRKLQFLVYDDFPVSAAVNALKSQRSAA